MAEACKRRKTLDLEMFLEEVRKYRFLYNKQEKNYKDVSLKKSLWAAIGTKFGLDGNEAEQKWKVQRDRYNRERKKIRESNRSGCGLNDIYRPTWELYELMDGILGNCSSENERTVNNISTSEVITEITVNCLEQMEDNYNDEVENIPPFDIPDTPIPDIPNIESAILKERDVNAQSKPSQQKRSNKETAGDCNFEAVLQSLNNASQSISNYFKNKSTQSDMIAKFCEYLECRLRNLDPHQRIDAIQR